MKIQKQLSKKRERKIYYKYALVIPKECVKESGLEGYDLEAQVNNGEIRIRKKEQEKQFKKNLKDVKAGRIKRVA